MDIDDAPRKCARDVGGHEPEEAGECDDIDSMLGEEAGQRAASIGPGQVHRLDPGAPRAFERARTLTVAHHQHDAPGRGAPE